MNHSIDVLLEAKSLCKINMEILSKKEDDCKRNKMRSNPAKPSGVRKSTKKDDMKLASRPKRTVLQSTTLIKDITNAKTSKSKSPAQGSFPAIRHSKTIGTSKPKTGAIRKQRTILKSNQNVPKITSKAIKTESMQSSLRKVDAKSTNSLRISNPMKLDDPVSKGGTSNKPYVNELNEDLHTLRQRTQVDNDVKEERGIPKPEKKTGTIPKITKKELDKENEFSNDTQSTLPRLNLNKNKDEQDRDFLPRSSSFHRDRIKETLVELDQIMESGKSTPTTASKDKKPLKSIKKKKNTKLKASLKTDEDKNISSSYSDSQETETLENGSKGIDKYLCSLSGGEARIRPDKVKNSITEAIDITEKIHTPDISLNQRSFPESSKSTTDNDVSFLLGNNVASKISSTQKSISDKWKPKTVFQEPESCNDPINTKVSKEIDPSIDSSVVHDIDIDDASNHADKLLNLHGNKKPNKLKSNDSSNGEIVNNEFFKDDEEAKYEKGANKDEQDEDDIIEELSCPICYEALHVPQVLDPCKHIFCDPCLRRMADAPRSEAAGCPMCRTEIKSCTTNIDLVKQIKAIYPKQYKAREQTEEASGVFDLPLPPTPPKIVNPFSLSGDENEFGTSGGIVMQMPTGQFVVMPLTPTTATVGVIVEMLELAYLSNVLQLLRQRSNNLEEMLLESRRMYEGLGDPAIPPRLQMRRRQQNLSSSRFSQQFPPARFRLTTEQRSGLALSDEREERRSRPSSDPLDFNRFMDDVYQRFPFN